MDPTAEVVICGAGIAGISAAYHLAVKEGIRNILLVDPEPPLSVTSDKSTECYRNWWPGPGDAMVGLVNRSIDLMEALAETNGNAFHLSRRGYLYLAASPTQSAALQASAREISQLGAGPLRVYSRPADGSAYQPAQPEGYAQEPTGADLILEPGLIHQLFPYITGECVAALHVRRAGWVSAQQLGACLLEGARASGVRLLRTAMTGIEIRSGRVQGVRLGDGQKISTPNFVNASGPYLARTSRLIGIELPVFTELHLKVAFKDTRGVIPRDAPLLIWTDPQRLLWSVEERAALADDQEASWLLEEFPGGVHTRPEGGPGSQIVLMLWEYHTRKIEPVFPVPLDPDYPEIVLRGLTRMLPGLQTYFDRFDRPYVDGGYYTKTPENRPLIGPLPVEGAFVTGAFSGYGLMAGCAAGELLACHLARRPLPSYASAFLLERYQDPAYQRWANRSNETGQL